MSHLVESTFFTRQSFISMLKSEFLDEGQTVVITTHEIDEVQDIDRSYCCFIKKKVQVFC